MLFKGNYGDFGPEKVGNYLNFEILCGSCACDGLIIVSVSQKK